MDTYLTEREGVVTKKRLSGSPPPYENPPDYHSLAPELLMDARQLGLSSPPDCDSPLLGTTHSPPSPPTAVGGYSISRSPPQRRDDSGDRSSASSAAEGDSSLNTWPLLGAATQVTTGSDRVSAGSDRISAGSSRTSAGSGRISHSKHSQHSAADDKNVRRKKLRTSQSHLRSPGLLNKNTREIIGGNLRPYSKSDISSSAGSLEAMQLLEGQGLLNGHQEMMQISDSAQLALNINRISLPMDNGEPLEDGEPENFEYSANISDISNVGLTGKFSIQTPQRSNRRLKFVLKDPTVAQIHRSSEKILASTFNTTSTMLPTSFDSISYDKSMATNDIKNIDLNNSDEISSVRCSFNVPSVSPSFLCLQSTINAQTPSGTSDTPGSARLHLSNLAGCRKKRSAKSHIAKLSVSGSRFVGSNFNSSSSCSSDSTKDECLDSTAVRSVSCVEVFKNPASPPPPSYDELLRSGIFNSPAKSLGQDSLPSLEFLPNHDSLPSLESLPPHDSFSPQQGQDSLFRSDQDSLFKSQDHDCLPPKRNQESLLPLRDQDTQSHGESNQTD